MYILLNFSKPHCCHQLAIHWFLQFISMHVFLFLFFFRKSNFSLNISTMNFHFFQPYKIFSIFLGAHCLNFAYAASQLKTYFQPTRKHSNKIKFKSLLTGIYRRLKSMEKNIIFQYHVNFLKKEGIFQRVI